MEQIDVATKNVKLWMDANSGTPVSLKNSQLDVTESSGTLSYDPTQHTITDVVISFKTKGTLTLVVQGQELPSQLDLTLTSKATRQP